jgi:hypothetical protein
MKDQNDRATADLGAVLPELNAGIGGRVVLVDRQGNPVQLPPDQEQKKPRKPRGPSKKMLAEYQRGWNECSASRGIDGGASMLGIVILAILFFAAGFGMGWFLH